MVWKWQKGSKSNYWNKPWNQDLYSDSHSERLYSNSIKKKKEKKKWNNTRRQYLVGCIWGTCTLLIMCLNISGLSKFYRNQANMCSVYRAQGLLNICTKLPKPTTWPKYNEQRSSSIAVQSDILQKYVCFSDFVGTIFV